MSKKKILTIFSLIFIYLTIIFLGNNLTGYVLKTDEKEYKNVLNDQSIYKENVIIPGSFKELKFDLRFDEDIMNKGSWIIAGLGKDVELNGKQKAVFFIDAGALNAFLDLGNGKRWCDGFLINWQKTQNLRIIPEKDFTKFVVNDQECILNGNLNHGESIIFNGKNDRGDIKIEVMNVLAK